MAYEELKARQSVLWGNGPYQRITETIIDIHERVVDTLDPEPEQSWLDLACGTGAVAERAAAAGASVTGVDLAPALIETAKERAGQLGLDIEYIVGDCEQLQLPDGSFEVVSSTCGVMFAPDHEAVAGELARVTAPGGRIVLANWTPVSGGLSELFKIMASTSRPLRPAVPSTGATSDASRSSWERLSTSSSRRTSHRSRSSPARSTGSSSRHRTARPRPSPRRSATGGRSSVRTGSGTSRRTIARTTASSTSANTCS